MRKPKDKVLTNKSHKEPIHEPAIMAIRAVEREARCLYNPLR